ncbi:MAG: hypothetical protein HFI42_12235 [Lachnospiraceae bacterium]|nr:hypothetical protein [Lachnospiraceae bacterium]
MKIESSAVGMHAAHSLTRQEQVSSAFIVQTQEQAAKLELSKEGTDLARQLKDEEERIQEETAKEQKERQARSLARHLQQSGRTRKNGGVPEVSDQYKMKLEMLKKMFEAMGNVQKGKSNASAELMQLKKAYNSRYSAGSTVSWMRGGSVIDVSGGAGASGGGTKWVKTTVSSAFVAETEHTAFQANGVVKTADGRELNFGVTVEMSRAFAARYDKITQEDYIVTDPLVINLNTNVASVSDQKFLFDIDSDGKEESISFAGKGSGFLALDKNKDGRINDGSELFGTRSGDGFRDLAAYDEDGNGWIDENDSIFKDLKVWTKDENGKDILMDLRQANVGAIYLGSTETEFSLNRAEDNHTDGIIRRTGLYLKETGEVGTIQHVDLTL